MCRPDLTCNQEVASITKHLRVLEGVGIVHNVQAGRESLFQFDPELLEEMKRDTSISSLSGGTGRCPGWSYSSKIEGCELTRGLSEEELLRTHSGLGKVLLGCFHLLESISSPCSHVVFLQVPAH
jgi:hypothetical protein